MKTDPPETRADQRLDDFYAVRAARAVMSAASPEGDFRLGAASLVMLRAAVAELMKNGTPAKLRAASACRSARVGLIRPQPQRQAKSDAETIFLSCVLFHSPPQ